MRVDDIRVFIPSNNYQVSQSFYQALGFETEYVSESLTLCQNGDCSFFLQDFYNRDLANNFMLQLVVADVQAVYDQVTTLTDFGCRFEPIKNERWGKVFYLWGPAGELLHVTEFHNNTA